MAAYSSHDLERRIHQIDLERSLLKPDNRGYDNVGDALTILHAELRKQIQLGLEDDAISLALEGIDYDLSDLSALHEQTLYDAGIFEECDRIYTGEILGEQMHCLGNRIDANRIVFRNVLRLDLMMPTGDVSIPAATRIVVAPFLAQDVINVE